MREIKARALLFDMDGTLVESTLNVEKVWSIWCNKHGISIDKALTICHGLRSKEVIQKIAPYLNMENELKYLEQLEIESSSNSCEIAGAKDFLACLHNSLWAVVTSASREVALCRMKNSGLPIPRVLIGSEDVINGKPNPESYQLAAKHLDIPTNECIVFEDSLAGIESALAAGCKVIQIGNGLPLRAQVEGIIHNWYQIRVSVSIHGVTLLF